MGLPKSIRNNRIVVVEGHDEQYLFEELLQKYNIANVEIVNIGGKDRFSENLPKIQKVTGFRTVTHLGIIRDQDEDNAFESVQNILKNKFGFSSIPERHSVFAGSKPKLGVFIMPGHKIEGAMIEDLCLKTVESKPEMECVNEFIECTCNKEIQLQNLSKTKVQAFLAVQTKSVPHLGVGAKKGYWDFDHPCMDELKAFLENFR